MLTSKFLDLQNLICQKEKTNHQEIMVQQITVLKIMDLDQNHLIQEAKSNKEDLYSLCQVISKILRNYYN